MNQTNAMRLKEKLHNFRLVPVVSLPSVEAALKLSEILTRCGLPVAEITFRTSCAVEGMAAIKKVYPELLLLAGTVLNPGQVDQAVSAGATGIVSPGFTEKMATYCSDNNIPFFPGVCTPSEVQAAMEAGLTSLKFFPAEIAGGAQMLSLFKAIYQDISFMPTGGVNIDNLGDYLNLGNILCCGGTWLSPKNLMAKERWSEIEERITAAVRHIDKLTVQS